MFASGFFRKSNVFLVALLFVVLWVVSGVDADCRYDDETHDEGAEVPTAEPCLNCTCSKGVLLCYLRVCTRLPNPPPPGCILLHRHRTCCPELICSEVPGGNHLEGRSEPEDGLDVLVDRKILGNACVSNGSIYGPGSAMGSSSSCEYCYCIGGKEICIEPKCLEPMEGCTPNFDPAYCCPIHYNCTSSATSTTTVVPQPEPGGCFVDGVHQKEGGKVLGVGRSACDNCYCLKGLVRCEPLSCAPPILGCSPVTKPGECCAASYNCSGTIEIEAEPFYGRVPTISKVYSKLRKQAQLRLPADASGVVTVSPQYVPSGTAHFRQRSPGTLGTTRQFGGGSFAQERNSTTSLPVTESVPGGTTNYEYQNAVFRRVLSTSEKPKLPGEADGPKESLSDNLFSLFESFLNDKGAATTTEYYTGSTFDDTTTVLPTTTALDAETTTAERDEEPPSVITVRTVLQSSDCTNHTDQLEFNANEVNGLTEKGYEDFTSTEMGSSESTTELDNAETLVASATLGSLPKLQSHIAAILNISKQKSSSEEEDIDYGESSLPPSLPNLRIIYFYPEDAVDTKKPNGNAGSQDRIQDGSSNFVYSNHFSPPEKTEGGFVPKDPPILDIYYDNAVSPMSIEQEDKPNVNCVNYDGALILHGQSVQSDSPCVTCTCFYGNIVCQKPNCPIPTTGCRPSSVQDITLCCPRYICDGEAPTVVLPHAQEAITVAEKLATPDPFRDVIRTEPAPNLQSLIIDMAPHIQRKTTPQHSTTNTLENTTPHATDNAFSFDKVLQFIFPEKNRENPQRPTTNFQTTIADRTVDGTSTPSPSAGGDSNPADNAEGEHAKPGPALPINLAGCNIYGRMYRVGKIIAELSGACLECKCTEVGVQCKALKC